MDVKGTTQQGQALPLALLLLVAVAALAFYMFNSGQLVQEKIRLTNTADAVAYSAGVYEARVLNYDAYTNRAIIANEIAIGQAVGLASWTKYASVTSYNIAPYLNLIPYVGPLIANALNTFAGYADTYTYIFAATVMAHDAAIQALSASQYAVHGPSNTVALYNRKVVMDEVARRNDPDVTVDLIPLSDNFAGFSQRYETKEERIRMGKVVQDSRDTFLVSRNWDFGLVLKILGCRVGEKLTKRGSTELIELTEGWKSMDTLSFHHFSISKKKFFRIRCNNDETPIGYATAFSDDNLPDSNVTYAGSRDDNPEASGKAEYEVATGFEPSTIGGGAIPAFYDLSESALEQKDPRTHIAIRVTKPKASQRFSGGTAIVRPTGSLDLYKGAHFAAESAAISRAEVYFERPDGGNTGSKAELGSLFNPYWQVRLAPLSRTERVLAQLKQGLLLP